MTVHANDTPYDRARLAFVRTLVPPGSGPALDVGCASGETTALLERSGYCARGIDVDPAAIRAARIDHPGLTFELGTVASAGTAAFSLVSCFEVIEHLRPADHHEFVAHLRRCLLPGGILVISTPGRWSLVSLYERTRRRVRGRRDYDWWDSTHVGVISARRLTHLLGASGFTIFETAGFHFLPARLATPFGRRGHLWRLGFSVLIVARAPTAPDQPPGRDSEDDAGEP